MKNLKFVLIAFVFLFVITACVNNTKNNNQPTNDQEQKNVNGVVEKADNEAENSVNSPLKLEEVEEWKTYKNDELGLLFKYPSALNEVKEIIGEDSLGINLNNVISLFSKSDEYRAGRGGHAGDFKNLIKDNGQYYFNFVWGPERITPKEVLSNGAVFVDCMSYEEKCISTGPSGSLFGDSIGGAILLNHDIFKGVFIRTNKEKIDEQLFLKILESINVYEPIKKTSFQLMEDLLKQKGKTVEIFKIFQEVSSPFDINVKAVLFGLDKSVTRECCIHPTALLINNNGTLGKEYVVLEGALSHVAIKNVEWINENKISYDQIHIDEFGEKTITKFLNLNN